MAWCAAVLFLASLGVRAQAPLAMKPSERPHFKSAIRLTTVTVTVTDAEGHLVRDLPREQFEVFEDGAEQSITQFAGDRVPVSLGILLDASDSMYGRRIADAREALDHFLSVLLDPADEFSLVVFNHHQQVLAPWDQRGPVAGADDAGAGEAVGVDRHLRRTHDGDSAGRLTAQPAGRTARGLRRCGHGERYDAALAPQCAAPHRSLRVCAIGIDSADRRPINAAVNPMTLGQITDPSGGRTRVVHDSSERRAALDQIAEELNSQYLIGYSSARAGDGQYHSIRVKVKGGDYRIRARNGYVDGAVPPSR